MLRAPSVFLRRRHERVRALLAAHGVDALLVTDRPGILYLTGFVGSGALLLCTANTCVLVTDSRYLTVARDLLSSAEAPPETVLALVEGSYDETLADVVEREGLRRLAFDDQTMTVARHDWLSARFRHGVALVPTRGWLAGLREVKDDFEIGRLRDGAARLAALVPAVRAEVRRGRRECEVAESIDGLLRRAGFSRPAFDTIVGSGPNGARPHATVTERRLGLGDVVVLDFGGVLDGYCVDLTRTVSVGRPGTEASRLHQAVVEAQAAAMAAVRPGVAAWTVDAAARAVLHRHGLGERFSHGTGHGLGLELHERPRITRRRPDASGDPEALLVPGMVFTVEPGLYLPGWGGVRIEDDLLVTETGFELLTAADRGLAPGIPETR